MKTKQKEDINQFGRACEDAQKWYSLQPDAKTAWNNCPRGDWMLWIAKKAGVNKRTLTLANGYCANTVIHLMKDKRSRDAVKVAIKYGKGLIEDVELNAAASAAYDADYDAAYAVYDADYDAAYAAAAASAAAAVYADYASAAAYAAYAVYDAAKTKNQKKTANICRKYLTKEFFTIMKIK